jgi:hypothetical protein
MLLAPPCPGPCPALPCRGARLQLGAQPRRSCPKRHKPPATPWESLPCACFNPPLHLYPCALPLPCQPALLKPSVEPPPCPWRAPPPFALLGKRPRPRPRKLQMARGARAHPWTLHQPLHPVKLNDRSPSVPPARIPPCLASPSLCSPGCGLAYLPFGYPLSPPGTLGPRATLCKTPASRGLQIHVRRIAHGGLAEGGCSSCGGPARAPSGRGPAGFETRKQRGAPRGAGGAGRAPSTSPYARRAGRGQAIFAAVPGPARPQRGAAASPRAAAAARAPLAVRPGRARLDGSRGGGKSGQQAGRGGLGGGGGEKPRRWRALLCGPRHKGRRPCAPRARRRPKATNRKQGRAARRRRARALRARRTARAAQRQLPDCERRGPSVR